MRVLALDFGTNTGYAHGAAGELSDCGTWLLAAPKQITQQAKLRFDRKLDRRIPTLYEHVSALHRTQQFGFVCFEDVQFSSTTKQTQLWSSFRAVVWLWAALNNVLIDCCPVGTLKLFATGHGGATKEMMAKHLLRGNPKFFLAAGCPHVQYHSVVGPKILDDNAVDAVHLFNWSQSILKNK